MPYCLTKLAFSSRSSGKLNSVDTLVIGWHALSSVFLLNAKPICCSYSSKTLTTMNRASNAQQWRLVPVDQLTRRYALKCDDKRNLTLLKCILTTISSQEASGYLCLSGHHRKGISRNASYRIRYMRPAGHQRGKFMMITNLLLLGVVFCY